jgi:FKBP-type peptidyl-prolyl cis-trans isomerase 2
LVYEVNKSDLENPGQYEEGQILYTPYGQSVKVSKVTKDKVYLDMNHELA